MKRQIFSLFLLLLTLVACGDKPLDPNKPVYVKIKTTMGDVTVLLYDDTPLHRDNFIKLCQSNEYEGMLFHRVIKEFVVQGGDPESKAHEPGALYGDGDGGYTVPAEILPNHFNKKGALIDAKEIDAVNPERASAGTQFCFELKKQDPSLAADSLENELHARASILVEDTLAVLGPVVIPAERREIYKTIGGVPHLDGSVTIFGEVVEGFDIVEKISVVKTDKNDRPLHDVMIKSTKVFQK